MAYQNTLVCAALIAGLSSSAALAWEHRIERGLDLYTTPETSVGLSLVCDPNKVYGSDESAVLVQLGVNPMAAKDVAFRFEDGMTVQARVERGHIMKSRTEGEAWQALLEGFREFSTVTIENDDDSVTVDLGDPVMFTCT
jgi:hypothetical protein